MMKGRAGRNKGKAAQTNEGETHHPKTADRGQPSPFSGRFPPSPHNLITASCFRWARGQQLGGFHPLLLLFLPPHQQQSLWLVSSSPLLLLLTSFLPTNRPDQRLAAHFFFLLPPFSPLQLRLLFPPFPSCCPPSPVGR